MAKKSTAKKVFSYLDSHPYARQSLVMGIANLSALSRRIKQDAKILADEGAVKAALRRYSSESKAIDYTRDLAYLLKQTRLSVKNKVSVLILKPSAVEKVWQIAKLTSGDYALLLNPSFSVLILSDEHCAQAMRTIGKPRISKIVKNQAAITLKTTPGLETSPGWVALFSDALSREGINIREFYSVYTETVFVISSKDALKAYRILDKMV